MATPAPPFIPYKVGDVIRLKESIPCVLHHGKTAGSECRRDSETATTGIDKKYEIIEVVYKQKPRTSLSPAGPQPEDFSYRLVSWLGNTRWREELVEDRRNLPFKIPHSVLTLVKLPPTSDNHETPFYEINSLMRVGGTREYSGNLQHEKVVVKPGDLLFISSDPSTSSGSMHSNLSPANAYYNVRRARYVKFYDYFWKSTENLAHHKIAGKFK